MTAVGVRELKQHLSEYLDRAERGELIRVTDRGRPKALLGPLPGRERIDAGIAGGGISPGAGGLAGPAAGRGGGGRGRRGGGDRAGPRRAVAPRSALGRARARRRRPRR